MPTSLVHLAERNRTGDFESHDYDVCHTTGQAIEIYSGANQRTESQPTVYVEIDFSAPAGRYIVWLSGKSDINSGYTDSVWLQVDDQIWLSRTQPRIPNTLRPIQ
jgi:hypothetical protein